MAEKTIWERLREPFPPERVLKLPATGKRPELDYVSHADVTDRLLAADPEWTWTWGVEDPVTGRPSKELSLVREGDEVALWMALTVGGVTRRDVGYATVVEYGRDGNSYARSEAMKHAVSDALRRCAMRFGVALDLWMKAESPQGNGQAASGAVYGHAVPCPQCGKPLRQRKGAKGPFIGCSGYPNCTFTADGTLAEMFERAEDGDVDPDDIHPPQTAPQGSPAEVAIARITDLIPLVRQEDIMAAFQGAGAADCLAPMADGGYKIRGAVLKGLPLATKSDIADRLAVAADEVPF